MLFDLKGKETLQYCTNCSVGHTTSYYTVSSCKYPITKEDNGALFCSNNFGSKRHQKRIQAAICLLLKQESDTTARGTDSLRNYQKRLLSTTRQCKCSHAFESKVVFSASHNMLKKNLSFLDPLST